VCTELANLTQAQCIAGMCDLDPTIFDLPSVYWEDGWCCNFYFSIVKISLSLVTSFLKIYRVVFPILLLLIPSSFSLHSSLHPSPSTHPFILLPPLIPSSFSLHSSLHPSPSTHVQCQASQSCIGDMSDQIYNLDPTPDPNCTYLGMFH
jgi:hypothetical protein